ncbi:hypothetical protein DFR24_0722 [Panacagrimonas perspica]|uniref:Uncharacterized protein n=1 Tax=Panacagrimonas perspica TaxID=381431 RepID=A0A4R7PBA4_9GAMM|nr:hypothetical protein [Panacagrimonas perspica]TDU31354.1 hypothetical protein DFR24_0722 [Panacagrimonas perspica]
MPDPMLFPFLDTAVRVIAILVLCAIPVLIPLPSSGRTSSRTPRTASKRALTSE